MCIKSVEVTRCRWPGWVLSLCRFKSKVIWFSSVTSYRHNSVSLTDKWNDTECGITENKTRLTNYPAYRNNNILAHSEQGKLQHKMVAQVSILLLSVSLFCGRKLSFLLTNQQISVQLVPPIRCPVFTISICLAQFKKVAESAIFIVIMSLVSNTRGPAWTDSKLSHRRFSYFTTSQK